MSEGLVHTNISYVEMRNSKTFRKRLRESETKTGEKSKRKVKVNLFVLMGQQIHELFKKN